MTSLDTPLDAPPDDELEAWVRVTVDRFSRTATRSEHFRLTDDTDYRRRLEWLRLYRNEQYRRVADATFASYQRTDPNNPQRGMAL